ncbi:hypothetical protein TTHERM_00219160 (macronuclear) [Tetrahymena thermophila SB210]|uniref:Uncharacterized protein n=1 Tax=Tetrahymena thermophila (strain SB210) TaxID=312017 RepID=I7LVY5_TETTS|nr:hypothetical protein TTHERM_00219160 [Tetrahymena thermophila SB210]EAS00343.2 hypothetical protein TTHERM_00219160 [Tetrahymena thermophila SB210]|eukprot:XP_001020588.2 hypothetical protein TTHERM_00219160 [Tetrahymena thermophila SB210]
MIQNARPKSQFSTLLYLQFVNEQQFKKSCQQLDLKEFILELSSSNFIDSLSLKNLGNICFMLATGIFLQYSQINSSLKDKVKLFAQSILNEKDRKDKLTATNYKTKRKNRTTTTNKKRDDRDQLIQDVFKSARAIRMQSINNLENSLAYRNYPSYILPNDMSLTYLLQNPLINPIDGLNEIQSHGYSNQSSQKMNDVMELDFLPQNDKIFEDIQIILNSDQSNQSYYKLSSFPSDIHLQIVDNQWESISQNSNINKNQSIRQEVMQEIMDNGFLDQPVDEETAQINLEEFERQQRLDLLRFQKQSTKKIQQELQNTNENLFTQLQNYSLKDRKIYKIKNIQTHQKTENNDNYPEFSQISSVTYNQNVGRKRGQKGRKNRDYHQKDKVKVILDTSIDQKINTSLNSSQDPLNTSQSEIFNSRKQQPQKQTSNKLSLNQAQKKNTKKLSYEKPDSFLQQLEINSLQQIDQFSNFQKYHLFNQNPNEIQFKSSNFQSSELQTNQLINHPLAQLDLIQHAISELDQTPNNSFKPQMLGNQKYDQIFRTNLKADQSLNSSFSYPQQSSEYSSQIAAVMHGEKQFHEQQYLMEEYQQYPFNQKFSTQKKDHDSSSNQSKQDQTSQKSKSLQKVQLNQYINIQPLANLSFNQIQMNESKRNQISHLNEFNSILDPIIEGQTSLMILQGMQDKSSLQCEGILQSPLYMQDSLLEINSSNTNLDNKENFLHLSKEANQLLQMIVQKIKEKKLKKLELEKNFSGTQQVKSFVFYNLLSLKAADKIELIQKQQLNFSPIEISINENQV